MKKKNVFCMLFVAFLLLKGTGVYAQENLGDKYAWRLDSVVYSYPLMTGEREEYGRLGRREGVKYTYGLDGLPTDSGFSTLDYEDLYTTRKPRSVRFYGNKHEYRSFGENGKRTELHYYMTGDLIDTTGAEIDNSLFALYQKDEYAFDSMRVIYDADGGIVRTIHHYDKTTTNYNYSTGACTSIKREQVLATDSTEDEKLWRCNVTTGVWSLTKDLHRDYINHRLTYSESTRRNFYSDGTLKQIWVDGTGYNELGEKTRTYSTYKIYQENGEPMPFSPGGHAWDEIIELFEGGRIVHYSDTRFAWYEDGMHSFAGNPTKDYEYLPNGMVIRTENGVTKYLVDLEGKDHLIYSQNPYWSDTYYSRYVYYDDFTLKQKVDSILDYTLERQGDSIIHVYYWRWTITDFDEQGNQIHKIERSHGTTETEWTYVREETNIENYTETVILQGNKRTTSRKYNYGFDNSYKLVEERDENGNWKSKDGYWLNVSFGFNGEPLTAVEYLRRNEQWTPYSIYTFTYIPEWDFYRRDDYKYSGAYIYFFTKSGARVGWYLRYAAGNIYLPEFDAFGRKTKDYECNFDSAMHTKDTLSYTAYRYFPVGSCTKVAERAEYFRNAETGAWEIIATPSRTNSYTHEVKDEKGNLAMTYTFRWEGDSIVTDSVDYKLVYDAQGRLYEQGLNGYEGNKDITRKRYLYYENDDPTAYRTLLLWNEYPGSQNKCWKAGSTNDDRTQRVYDEAGRVIERISFGISKDSTHAVPTDKYVYFYEDNNLGWVTEEHYKMNDGNWDCAGVTNRRLLLTGAERDEDGDITSSWKRKNTCGGIEDESLRVYSYAADVTTYPVLSPNSYRLGHEADLAYSEYVQEQVASKRVKDIVYSYIKNPNQSYMATYYYTQLREDVDAPRMPVDVATGETSAVFTWGAVEGAETYVLHVYADAAQTEEICYVVFDKYGCVISVNFIRHAPARYSEVEQLNYALDGLTPATNYWYSVRGITADGNTVESTNGSFKTKGESGGTATGIDEIPSDQVQCTKVIRGGHLVIFRDGEMYNAEGKRIQ
ncbi:MAG: fibronectin type III domain-containing protein [Bacteroidales bacterium]|nr:fibronectin type III domain-containing protein [Candidatus Colicola equi]